MGKTTWKKALINSAHTFMDYVVGWRGWKFTAGNPTTKASGGSWVVPQKITEVPQQSLRTISGDFSSIDMFYNLPIESGFNGTEFRYRYPANNGLYRALEQYQGGGADTYPCVKVDYKNNVSQDWNKSVAGLSIKGPVTNTCSYGTQLGATATQGTVWRLLNRSLDSNINVQEICTQGVGAQNQNYGSTDVNISGLFPKSPFAVNVNNTQNLWKIPYLGFMYGRILDTKYQHVAGEKKPKMTYSFYVWVGALKEEWATEVGVYPPITCSGSYPDGVTAANIDTLNVSTLAIRLVATSISSNTQNWNLESTNSESFLTVDLLNRTHTFSANTDPTLPQNFYIVDNVQFEDCPNDYLRVSIFYTNNPGEVILGRYCRFMWWGAQLGTTADLCRELFNKIAAFNVGLARQIWKEKYLVMYGQQLEVETQGVGAQARLNVEYRHNDYVPNIGDGSTNTSLNQVMLPNLVINNDEGAAIRSNNRCETIYFSLWIDNQDAHVNKENQGGFGSGSPLNFAQIRQAIHTPASSRYRLRNFITLGSDIPINSGNVGDLTPFQKANTRYVLHLQDRTAQEFDGYINGPQIEGINFIYLNSGVNKFAFSTGQNKVYVNGIAYDTDEGMYNAKFINSIEFFGKRNDYLLEYGTWVENQAEDVLIQLTKI